MTRSLGHGSSSSDRLGKAGKTTEPANIRTKSRAKSRARVFANMRVSTCWDTKQGRSADAHGIAWSNVNDRFYKTQCQSGGSSQQLPTRESNERESGNTFQSKSEINRSAITVWLTS